MAVSRVNLLNRTCFSTGFYRIRDLAVAASNGGLEILGISDDFFITPLSKECRNKKDFERLFLKDIYQQNQYIQKVRPDFPALEICFGGVVDMSFNYLQLPNIAPISGQFQYLLFKNVDQNNINAFMEYRRKFQCPIGFCQNNLKMSFPKFSIDRLVQLFAQHKIFIELDTRVPHFLENGKFFSRLRNTAARITIGTDTHQDLNEVCQIQVAVDYIERFGLENNLLQIHPPRLAERHTGQSHYRRYHNNRPQQQSQPQQQQRNTSYRPKEYHRNNNNRYYSRTQQTTHYPQQQQQQPNFQENVTSTPPSERQEFFLKEMPPVHASEPFPKATLPSSEEVKYEKSKNSYEYEPREKSGHHYRNNNNKSIRHYSRNYHQRRNPKFSEEKEGMRPVNNPIPQAPPPPPAEEKPF